MQLIWLAGSDLASHFKLIKSNAFLEWNFKDEAEILILLYRSLGSHGYMFMTVIFKPIWNGTNATQSWNSSAALGTTDAQVSAHRKVWECWYRKHFSKSRDQWKYFHLLVLETWLCTSSLFPHKLHCPVKGLSVVLPFYQASPTRVERKFSWFCREAKQRLQSWNLTKIALHNCDRSAVSLHSFVLGIFQPIQRKYLNRKILCRKILWKSC